MQKMINKLLGNLDQTEEVFFDDAITEASLSGNGHLITKLEEQKRQAEAYQFANECREIQDRLSEITNERASAISEKRAFESQLELAAEEWRRAKDLEDERRLEHAQLQLKLSYLDTKLDILREENSERTQELRQLLSSRNGGQK